MERRSIRPFALARRPSLAAAATLVAASALVADVRAAAPDRAPAASRAQVAAAIAALAPAFRGHPRRVRSGQAGSIESAIAAYAPGIFRPVVEGELEPPRPGATCPADMALVAGRVCVDRYEGSLVERAADGSLVAYPFSQPLLAGHAYVARSVAGVMPQAYISAAQSQAACRAAGKRLCAPVEWRAACGGTQGFAYPYGPTRVPGACHDSGVAPMLLFHADTMKRGWGPLELNDPRNVTTDGTLAPTGAFPRCVNDYGLYDMVGNLHEWTSDPDGTFQGGYWLDTSLHGEGCAYRTIAHPYDYHDYSTGFRCCADPRAP